MMDKMQLIVLLLPLWTIAVFIALVERALLTIRDEMRNQRKVSASGVLGQRQMSQNTFTDIHAEHNDK
jgi:hypothetical protein